MKKYLTKDILETALRKCGIKKGDVVLVHCNVSSLGIIEGTVKDYLKTYLDALKGVLGNKGTIVVPAYYYEYGRKNIPFDVKRSPVSRELGLFSKFIAGQKKSYRSINPITSLAAIGPKAKYICGGKTASAYGIDSGFDRLYKAKGKMVFLGVDLSVMTYVHYPEYMVGVPHLYNKYYETPIYYNGKKINLPVSGQVRYLNFKVDLGSFSNTRKFEKAGIVKKAKVGNGHIRVVGCQEAFEFLKTKLQRNFFYLLKSKPNFIKNQVPLI